MIAFALLIAGAVGAEPGSEPVLLDFTATWCGPCQQMSGTVARLQRMGYPIRKVDVDREPELARRYGVSSIPAFVLVAGGKEQGRLTGVQSEGQLKRLLQRIPALQAAARRRNQPAVRTAQADAPSEDSGQRKPGLRLPFFGEFGPGARRSRDSHTATEMVAAPATSRTPDVIRAKLNEPAEAAAGSGQPDDVLGSIVRLRIRDSEGASFGSGTVISSVPGRTVILTCGHVFRNYDQRSMIEVDVFLEDRHERFVGKLIRHDPKADVGLVSIATSHPLPASPVASHPVRKGDTVVSGGCSRGEAPTRQSIQVTALNRYRGPDNIECTGMPVQGRSGGGLFDSRGQVVGVCIAADPKQERGLYAGLAAVHGLLDEARLTHLYRPDAAAEGAANVAASESPAADFAPAGDRAAEVEGGLGGLSAGAAAAAAGALKDNAEAEVICIIRPLNNPQATSRVVIINRASGQFMRYLQGELEDQPKPTSIRVPHGEPMPAALDSEEQGTAAPVPHSRTRADRPQPQATQRYRRSAASRQAPVGSATADTKSSLDRGNKATAPRQAAWQMQ